MAAVEIVQLQEVIVESGAREAVEVMINEGHDRALAALEDANVTDEGRAGLISMAEAAVRRDF